MRTAHESGSLGLAKLMYDVALTDKLHRVIALDTDVLFTTDISQLWDQFELFNASQAVGAASQQARGKLKKEQKGKRTVERGKYGAI